MDVKGQHNIVGALPGINEIVMIEHEVRSRRHTVGHDLGQELAIHRGAQQRTMTARCAVLRGQHAYDEAITDLDVRVKHCPTLSGRKKP